MRAGRIAEAIASVAPDTSWPRDPTNPSRFLKLPELLRKPRRLMTVPGAISTIIASSRSC